MMRVLWLSLFMAASAVAAEAQTVDAFADLPGLLKSGATVFVADESGQTTKGKITELSPASIALLTSRDERIAIPSSRVRMVSRVDSKWNGFLIGAAAGAVPGALLGSGFKRYCENESASCPQAPLVMGALFGLVGGWIGAGIDGLIDGQKVVYQR
jgi:hypothetical protein